MSTWALWRGASVPVAGALRLLAASISAANAAATTTALIHAFGILYLVDSRS